MSKNLSNSANLIDSYAKAKRLSDKIEKHLKSLKAQIVAMDLKDGEELEGELYAIKVSIYPQGHLDTAKIKAILSEQQIEECTVRKPVTKLTVKASLHVGE